MSSDNKELKLSKIINRFKSKKGYSFKELEALSGVKMQTIANWAYGRNPRNVDDLRKFAKALNISLYFLLYGEADPFQESIIKDQDARNVLKALAEYLKKIEN